MGAQRQSEGLRRSILQPAQTDLRLRLPLARSRLKLGLQKFGLQQDQAQAQTQGDEVWTQAGQMIETTPDRGVASDPGRPNPRGAARVGPFAQLAENAERGEHRLKCRRCQVMVEEGCGGGGVSVVKAAIMILEEDINPPKSIHV